MGRIYSLLAVFSLGAGLAGLPSYSALLFPSIRPWSIYLALVVFALFLTAAICDDYLAQALGGNYQAYLFGLIGLALTLVTGAAIQWL